MKKTIIAFAVLGILLLASIGAYASSISDKQAQAWEHILSGSNANRMIAAIISLSAPTSLHLKKLGE